MITGTWKGKIGRQKAEIKIIQKGDSLTGTSYYYSSAENFRRYSIKGYFDNRTNEAVWWDDQLLEEKSSRFSFSMPGKVPLLSRADFNCPGGDKMMLNGKASESKNEMSPKGEVTLDKSDNPMFTDEWDWIIENYTVGTSDPEIIDSIVGIRGKPLYVEIAAEKPAIVEPIIIKESPQNPQKSRFSLHCRQLVR
ncbi:MAG: hypothetical protein IPM85_01970 [Chitinophagaceae bacterium]|nr:hypothetical protein [Chitinophagaceae bacterium]